MDDGNTPRKYESAAGGNGEVASRTKRPGSVPIRFFRASVRLKTMTLEAMLFLLLA